LRHLSTFYPIDQNPVLGEVNQADLLIPGAMLKTEEGVRTWQNRRFQPKQ
jgi:hypothetical protein